MPDSETIQKHLRRHLILLFVGLFLVIIIGGYAFGYRPGPGLTIVRVGTLIVTDLPTGSSLYADQSPRGTTQKAGSLSADLVPGNHTIIVDVPNQEPWSAIVAIDSSKTVTVSPILVPRQPDPKKLSGDDAVVAARAVSLTKFPTEAAPLSMGCTNVFVSANRVIVSMATTTPSCTPPEFLCSDNVCSPTIVYAPVAPLHSVIPFPNRTDAVIVSAGDWVYALGLDPRSPQYFAPIVRGTAPMLGTASSTTFYVQDAGHTYSVSF